MCDQPSFNCHQGFKPLVFHMDVGRRVVIVSHAHDDSEEDGNSGHGSLPKRILQPHRKIKHRLARRVVHLVRHKVAKPLKLKLRVRQRRGQ